MAIENTVNLGGKDLNFYYKVHDCVVNRTNARIGLANWYSREDYLAGKPFAYLKYYNVSDRSQKVDANGAVLKPASFAFSIFFGNSVLLKSGNSPFKQSYLYLKTLPEFEGAVDVNILADVDV